jgi:hypothetical protein
MNAFLLVSSRHQLGAVVKNRSASRYDGQGKPETSARVFGLDLALL